MDIRRVEVKALAGCPYKYVNKLYPPELGYAMRVGSQRHREIETRLRLLGYETEYEVRYSYLGMEIVGKIDALKHDPPIVLEIKSSSLGMRDFRQLLLYRDILFLTTGKIYRPAFVIYEGDRVRLEANFLWLPPVLHMWKEVKKVILWIKSRGCYPRIRCDDCVNCLERDRCKPDLAYTPYRIKRLGTRVRR